MNKTAFVEKLNQIWKLAREIIVSDGNHSPVVFLFSPGGRMAVVSLALAADVAPRDVIPKILAGGGWAGFAYVGEAWMTLADSRRVDALTLFAATRDYQESRAVEVAAGRALVNEGILSSDMPGAELRGAFPDMQGLLSHLQ